MWGRCKIVNFSWLLFSTLVICQHLLTQKNTLSKWSVNALYCVNGLHVGLCVLCVKMRTFLCGESTVAALQKKLLSTLPGSLINFSILLSLYNNGQGFPQVARDFPNNFSFNLFTKCLKVAFYDESCSKVARKKKPLFF